MISAFSEGSFIKLWPVKKFPGPLEKREVNVTQRLSSQSHAKRLDISHLSMLRYDSIGDSLKMNEIAFVPTSRQRPNWQFTDSFGY